MSETLKTDRLTAIDLGKLSEAEMATLRKEAMQRGLSMSELLAEFVLEVTRRQKLVSAGS